MKLQKIKLAKREHINPKIVTEWLAQAREWLSSNSATASQKHLASAVVEQWG